MKFLFKTFLITFTLSQAVMAGRMYDPEVGRFISRDPVGYVDGMSLYNAYFAEQFALDPMGYEFAYPEINVNDIKKAIDSYNKDKGKNDPYPTDDQIKQSKENIEAIKKWVESVIKGKTGSKELQDYLKCLDESKIKINISVDYTRQTSKNKKTGEITYYGVQGALTRGYGIVDNNEVNIDFNFKAKRISEYTFVHELLHIIEFSVVFEKEYQDKYNEKPLDCECTDKIKEIIGKKHKWRIIHTMHDYRGGFKMMVDKIQQDHFKMKSE